MEFIDGVGEIMNFILSSSGKPLRHAAILLFKEVSNVDAFTLILESAAFSCLSMLDPVSNVRNVCVPGQTFHFQLRNVFPPREDLLVAGVKLANFRNVTESGPFLLRFLRWIYVESLSPEPTS